MMNKRLKTSLIVVALLIMALALVYFNRGWIRDAWWEWTRPALPPATPYRSPNEAPSPSGTEEGVGTFESGYSSSEHYVIETSPKTAPQPKPSRPLADDSLVPLGALPAEANLDVPFTMQAPHSNWAMPYQEMCEEASIFMVDRFYKGQTGSIDKDEADREMLKIVDYENRALGYYKDTTAVQTAEIIKGYFGYTRVSVLPLTSPDDIKKIVAAGYPVIVPAAGKLLKNPYFRNGGPVYHMVVVRGYTSNTFIVNDPGIGRGYGYIYDYATLMNAAHDWDDGNVTEGKKVMLVVMP